MSRVYPHPEHAQESPQEKGVFHPLQPTWGWRVPVSLAAISVQGTSTWVSNLWLLGDWIVYGYRN